VNGARARLQELGKYDVPLCVAHSMRCVAQTAMKRSGAGGASSVGQHRCRVWTPAAGSQPSQRRAHVAGAARDRVVNDCQLPAAASSESVGQQVIQRFIVDLKVRNRHAACRAGWAGTGKRPQSRGESIRCTRGCGKAGLKQALGLCMNADRHAGMQTRRHARRARRQAGRRQGSERGKCLKQAGRGGGQRIWSQASSSRLLLLA
jgi:hypothetical protein